MPLPLDPSKVGRAVKHGWDKLEITRAVRNLAMREAAGPWYGQCPDFGLRTDDEKRPLNLLRQIWQTYTPNLCGPVIKNRVKPRLTVLRGQAMIREAMIDRLCEEIQLAQTHRLCVVDAIFGGVGIYKTGIAAGSEQHEVFGEMFDAGAPYCVRIDLDDFARDPQSRDPLEDQWRAYRYRVPKQTLIDSGLYDPDAVMALQVVGMGQSSESGYSDQLANTQTSPTDTLTELVEVWDVVVYDGDKCIEMSIPSTTCGQFLREPQEWQGHGRGPLHMLTLLEMPNNTEPVSVAQGVMDLHLALARTGTKAVNQILAAKSQYVVGDAAGVEMAMTLHDSPDQEIIVGSGQIQKMDFGGAIPAVLEGLASMNEMANNATANIQQTSGNATTGGKKTATESTYLQQNSSTQLSDMRQRCEDKLKEVVRSLAWYMDTNPFMQGTYKIRMQGGAEVDVQYSAEQKKGDFTDFVWDIHPSSTGVQDPNMERARFNETMQTVATIVPVVAQFGGNVGVVMRIIGEVNDLSELDEIFPQQDFPMQQQALAQQAPPGQIEGAARTPAKAPQFGRPIDQTRSDMAASVPAGAAA